MNFKINKLASYQGHKDSVYCLGEGTAPGTVLSAGGDGYLVEWSSPDAGHPLARVNHSIYAFEHLVSDRKIWLGENTQGLHLLNILAKQVEVYLPLPRVSIFAIASTELYTLVGSSAGFVHVVDRQQNQFLQHIQVSDKSIRAIAIGAQRGVFAVGASDHCIYLYDLATFSLLKVIEGHENSVFTLAWHGQYLLSSGRDAHIRLWDAELDFLPAVSVPAHNYAINHILPLQGTPLLASCSMDKSIRIWDIDSLTLLKVIDKSKNASHGTSVNRLWWNPDSQHLYSASDDRTLAAWQLFDPLSSS